MQIKEEFIPGIDKQALDLVLSTILTRDYQKFEQYCQDCSVEAYLGWEIGKDLLLYKEIFKKNIIDLFVVVAWLQNPNQASEYDRKTLPEANKQKLLEAMVTWKLEEVDPVGLLEFFLEKGNIKRIYNCMLNLNSTNTNWFKGDVDLEDRANFNLVILKESHYEEILNYACQLNNLDLIKRLLTDYKIYLKDYEVLRQAFSTNCVELVKFLLKENRMHHNYIAGGLSGTSRPEMVELFINNNSVNLHLCNLLREACCANNVETILVLLKDKCVVEGHINKLGIESFKSLLKEYNIKEEEVGINLDALAYSGFRFFDKSFKILEQMLISANVLTEEELNDEDSVNDINKVEADKEAALSPYGNCALF